MIDFHSHILPNLDDGAKNIEETFKLIAEAKSFGFSKVISTTHYLERFYESTAKERKIIIDNLNSKLNGIQIILGNEIYTSENMLNLLKENKAATIGESNYVLYEFPMNNKPFNIKETIKDLQNAGYIPVIAHPERYTYVQEEPDMLYEFIQMGALFQANYGSIVGVYGNKAKKTLKILLKHNMIHFFGSDVHREGSIYPKVPIALKKLEKIVSKERLKKLTTENAQKVLNNEKIEIENPIKIKHGIFGKW